MSPVRSRVVAFFAMFIMRRQTQKRKKKAPPRFELGISCLLDRRFNQLSHGAIMPEQVDKQVLKILNCWINKCFDVLFLFGIWFSTQWTETVAQSVGGKKCFDCKVFVLSWHDLCVPGLVHSIWAMLCHLQDKQMGRSAGLVWRKISRAGPTWLPAFSDPHRHSCGKSFQSFDILWNWKWAKRFFRL